MANQQQVDWSVSRYAMRIPSFIAGELIRRAASSVVASINNVAGSYIHRGLLLAAMRRACKKSSTWSGLPWLPRQNQLIADRRNISSEKYASDPFVVVFNLATRKQTSYSNSGPLNSSNLFFICFCGIVSKLDNFGLSLANKINAPLSLSF